MAAFLFCCHFRGNFLSAFDNFAFCFLEKLFKLTTIQAFTKGHRLQTDLVN